MERPDPGTAELTDAAGAAQPVEVVTRAARRRVLPFLLLVLLCGLVVAIVATLVDARSADSRAAERRAALQTARQQAVNLTTISYQTAERDLARIIAASTGTLKTQFQTQAKSFPGVLRTEKSVSTGRVLAAGVKSQDGKVVEALVAVDATVRNAASGGAGVVKHYRMDMRLVLVGRRWLVSTVAFAGLPQ